MHTSLTVTAVSYYQANAGFVANAVIKRMGNCKT